MLKYHFSIHIHFKKDIDLSSIEKEIGLKASKKSSFSECSENPKLAKILFKTESFTNSNVLDTLREFVNSLNDLFVKINEICEINDGFSGLVVYFERFESKSQTKIDLDYELTKILINNNIYFDTECKE